MGIEIERKFLVAGDGWRGHGRSTRICQGYLNRDKARTVRVRIAGEQAFLTVKGLSAGAVRAEFEYAIPPADAQQLLALCDGPVIDKVRHAVEHEGLVWEIDEFLGDNQGLLLAEVELRSEDQAFARPAWAGEEVTDDPRYYNSNLAEHPFTRW